MRNARTNSSTAHQLTLLPDLAPAPNVSARFLLSHDTRELGMRHVAAIRQMLAERKAACSTWKATLGRGGSKYFVDGMDNKAKMTFMAAPDRLYVGDAHGTVQYQGAPGPFGWDIQGFKNALTGLL